MTQASWCPPLQAALVCSSLTSPGLSSARKEGCLRSHQSHCTHGSVSCSKSTQIIISRGQKHIGQGPRVPSGTSSGHCSFPVELCADSTRFSHPAVMSDNMYCAKVGSSPDPRCPKILLSSVTYMWLTAHVADLSLQPFQRLS